MGSRFRRAVVVAAAVGLLGVVPAAAQEVPDVSVVSSSWWTDATATHLVGEIRNNGPQTVIVLQIRATPVDGTGTPLGAASTTGTWTWALWLKPNEKAPFDLLFPPVAPADFDVEVTAFNTGSTANRFFQLAGLVTEPSGRVTGTVTNLNLETAGNVKVMATYYDATGKVVDVAQGIAGVLAAGQTLPFVIDRLPGAPGFASRALLVESSTPAAPPPIGAPGSSGLALFDPLMGRWHLRYPETPATPVSFYYGTPGDLPLLGDWDGDGIDTVAMFRPSNGFIYLRNSNTFGVADQEFFYGLGGDIPLAGDWDGDGKDTFAIYRPSEGRVYIRNSLGTGAADYSFFFGVPGDRPFAGDFDGDGTTTVGLYRESTGFVYFRNVLSTGVAEFQFFYGEPSDRIVAGDWDADGTDTVGIFRPANAFFYLSNENAQKAADVEFPFGQGSWLPAAGELGTPPG